MKRVFGVVFFSHWVSFLIITGGYNIRNEECNECFIADSRPSVTVKMCDYGREKFSGSENPTIE